MNDAYSTQKLLALRKLTRAMAEFVRGQARDYLNTLAPLLRPKAFLGEYIQGSSREGSARSERAFQELQRLYAAIANSGPFALPKELHPPLELEGAGMEMTPVEYVYETQTNGASKKVVITSPLKWVLTYAGFGPTQLREQLAKQRLNDTEVQRSVLHFVALQVVLSYQKGAVSILEALRFPVESARLPEFGDLPLTVLASPVKTVRPPDAVIVESTEISGRDAFEEVVDVEAIGNLPDPFKARLLELVQAHGF
jgi:hypothetical protein